jgi:hypothetical protein
MGRIMLGKEIFFIDSAFSIMVDEDLKSPSENASQKK